MYMPTALADLKFTYTHSLCICLPTALADPKITYTHSPCICLPLWPTLNYVHYFTMYMPTALAGPKLRTLSHRVYAYRSGRP